MTYQLGAKSIAELKGVHPNMVRIVERAIAITAQDFSVNDGGRTIEEQREFVARGVSKTMNSRHLVQADGFGHAVDLVPWINGKARWEWGGIWEIAVAMAMASAELGIEIVWGGVWDRRMSQYATADAEDVKRAVEDYKMRHAGSDFLDGPHFELSRDT